MKKKTLCNLHLYVLHGASKSKNPKTRISGTRQPDISLTCWDSNCCWLVGVGECIMIEDGAGCGEAGKFKLDTDLWVLLGLLYDELCCWTDIICCLATINLSFNWWFVRSSSRILCCWSSINSSVSRSLWPRMAPDAEPPPAKSKQYYK